MRKTMTAVVAAAVVGGIGLPASPANAVESVELYSGDLTVCDSPDYQICEPNDVTGHELLPDGMRLHSSSYAGYTSATFALDTTLAEVTNASVEWEGSDSEPGVRISGDFDGDGQRDTLWAETIYDNDWWLSGSSSQAVKDVAPSDAGGSGSQWHGTPEEWADEFPDGVVDRGGYTLGVPADGVISSMTYGDTTYTFTNAPKTKSEVYENGIRPDETTYSGWHQGAADAAGKYQVTNDGLVLDGKSQVINGYEAGDFTGAPNLPLGWTLENASYTVAAGDAWFQVPLFFDYDAHGEAPKFTTLRPATAAQGGGNEISLDDQWVSSRAIKDVIPANTPTPLSEIVAALGSNYNVLGFGVFADTGGSATVSQITWDDTKYKFKNRAPLAKTVKVSTTARHAVNIELPAVDADGNELSYKFGDPVNGEVTDEAGTFSYTPDKNFTGKDRVRYTVEDGRGSESTGLVNVKVAKLTSEITGVKVKPAKVTPKKRATVVVKVRAGDEAATGKVSIKDGRKVFGPKRLEDGKVSIKLAKLSKGKHALVAKYLGNKVTTKDNAKFTIKVVKK